MNTSATTSASWKWHTSGWRFLLLSLAGGIISYHLFYQLSGFFYIKDGYWTAECAVAAFGFALGNIVNIALHELGHASVARMLKCPVYTIEYGLGLTRAKFQLWGMPFHIRSFPPCGIVRWGPNSLRYPRLQRACVTGGGMMTTLFLFIATLLVFQALDLQQSTFSSDRWFVAFWAGVTGSTVALISGTWIPFYGKREGHRLGTDAMNILRLPWLTNDYLHEQSRIIQIRSKMEQMLDSRLKTVEEALNHAANDPLDLKAQFNACYHLHVKGDLQAIEFARAALELPPPDSEARAILLDFWITIALDHDILARDPKARLWLEESFSKDKVGVGNLATYGAGLIDLDEDEAGMKILEDVVKRTKQQVNLTYTHVFLAIGYRKQRKMDEARNHAQKAAQLYPACHALKRIDELLPAKSEAVAAK